MFQPRSDSEIGVHIFGVGDGESIVIELPGAQRRLGVIDSFKILGPEHTDASSGRVPFLPRFLKRLREPSKPVLEFLVITHPHADHCLGIRELLEDEEIEIQQLCLFAGFDQLAALEHYYRRLRDAMRVDLVEGDLQLTPGAVHAELCKLMEYSGLPHKPRRTVTTRILTAREPIHLTSTAANVVCLTPGAGCVQRYRGQVMRAADPESRSRIEHNLTSVAIAIRWGATKLLLLADAETPLWDEWRKDYYDEQSTLVDGVQLIKVAHHGSENGYSAKLYNHACAPETRPILVVTPFGAGPKPLPTPQGIGKLLGHCPRLVVCTSLEHARDSTEMEWIPWEGTEALPAFPDQWIVDLQDDPERCKNVLSPDCGGPLILPDQACVPASWVRLLLEHGELRRLLHPDIGGWKLTRMDPLTDGHRVSFFFNDRGEVTGRFIGDGAGVLKT